mgnify:CR=1 FL=1
MKVRRVVLRRLGRLPTELTYRTVQYVDPWYARGLKSVNNLTGIARTRVNERLEKGAGDRKDILSHLQNGKDAEGNPMGVPELTMEGAWPAFLASWSSA